jgi:hydroxymethylpyrimidine/phosphomethylpyrimidine kinase
LKPKSKILIIAGSDSSGGAGIQADIKTVTSLGSYAMTAITAITSQNTTGVYSIKSVPENEISNQIEFTAKDVRPDAIKIGMLHSEDVIKSVLKSLDKIKVKKIILDPVMVAKGGAKLINYKSIKILKSHLIKKVSILTPNIPEAEILAGIKINNLVDMKTAGEKLIDLGASFVVLKGGHMNTPIMSDFLIGEEVFDQIETKKIETNHTHGTGCTMASALAAGLAKSYEIKEAFQKAHFYVNQAIITSPRFGNGHGPINHSFNIN